MNYFKRNLPEQNKLQNCLNGISKEFDDYYQSNSLKEDNFIRLHSSTLGKDELISFSKAFLEGNITLGKYNENYEKLACDIFDSNFAITSNSGSSANLIAISSLVQAKMLNPGDKVIVPVLAWSTTVFPLAQYGLIPVYVDISFDDFNLSKNAVEDCIKDHDIKAIMLIHTYGNPADLDFFVNLSRSKSILLIEDNCESMGATWNGKSTGSFGDVGTFSSYFSHHICTLEGGITVCKDKNLSDLMRSIRSHGWIRGLDINIRELEDFDQFDPSFLFLNTGYNLRLSDPQAAMGCIQINKLNQFVKSRESIADRYIKNISNSSVLEKNVKFPIVDERASSSWFGFPILLPKINYKLISRIKDYLKNSKIETRPFLAGDFSKQPVNKKFENICFNSCPNIHIFHKNSFALPCHQDLTLDNVDKVCETLECAINAI